MLRDRLPVRGSQTRREWTLILLLDGQKICAVTLSEATFAVGPSHKEFSSVVLWITGKLPAEKNKKEWAELKIGMRRL